MRISDWSSDVCSSDLVKDLVNGIADGYDDIELLKRYSTVGMGPSQGRHSAVAAVRILARETGTDLARLGVTTQRPPYLPEKFALLAGRGRSEEGRVGQECVSKGRSRWFTYTYKKKNII